MQHSEAGRELQCATEVRHGGDKQLPRPHAPVRQIAQLLNMVKATDDPWSFPPPRQIFGGDPWLVFVGREATQLWSDVVSDVLSLPDYQHASSGLIQRALIDAIRQKGLAPNADADEVWSAFRSNIHLHPMEAIRVAAILGGVRLQTEAVLSPIRLETWSEELKQAMLDRKHNEAMREHLWPQVPFGSCLISTSISARDSDVAYEGAQQRFESFVNILRCLFPADRPPVTRIELGDVTPVSRSAVLETQKGIVLYGSLRSAAKPLDVDDKFLAMLDRFHLTWLIEQLAQPPQAGSAVSRLLRATSWRGRAAHDLDDADAFVQAMFALECLLSRSQPNDPIQPSVTSQVAEGVAFLLGEGATQRRELLGLVKDLYSLRSQIVHGRRTEVTRRDLAMVFDFSEATILKVLGLVAAQPDLNLSNYIDDMKFR